MRTHTISLGARALSLTLALSCASALAAAHDYWIEPSATCPELGELVRVQHFVGHPGHAEERERNDEHSLRFAALSPAGEVPIVGRDRSSPAGYLRPSSVGPLWLVYESSAQRIEMPGDKFSAYLREEGLDAVLEERARRGTSATPGRELYSRCAKSLVHVVAAPDEPRAKSAPVDFSQQFTGLPLELIPGRLQLADSSGAWSLTLLYAGRPLEGALVELTSLDEPRHALRSRTDTRGVARFELPRGGRWLAAAVHMVPETERSDADWRSYWASLSLEISSAPAAR